VVTLVTGADYVVRAIRMSKAPQAKKDGAVSAQAQGK
jgi:hypothetical protein